MIPYAQLRKSPRLDLAAAIPLPAPFTIYVEPTNRCNLSCDFCPQSLDDYEEKTGARQDMPLLLYRKVMNEIREMGIKSLKLYFFGEPLLHPEITLMLHIATSACARVELTTNGMALTRKNAQAILDSGLHYLRISLYNVKPELVMRNIDRLMAMRREQEKALPIVAVKVFNRDEFEAARAMYSGIVDEVIIEGLHTIGSEFVQISTQPRASHIACPYPFYNLVVKSNGDVVPCCVAWEDSLVVGNVRTQTLAEIWAGPALARIHRLHLEGRRTELAACAKCDTLFNCPDNVDSLTVAEYDQRIALRSAEERFGE